MGAKNKMAFRELPDAAKEAARRSLLCEIEENFRHEKMIAQFVSDAKTAGISVIPESVRLTRESGSFSVSGIDLPVVLERSGIGRRFLSAPGDFELFCAYATAEICQTLTDSADARRFSVSVAVDQFDNNDNGRAFAACDIAAGFLERYLRNLTTSLSVRLHELFEREREHMTSRSFLDEILEAMGPVFLENGDWEKPDEAERR